METHPIGQKVIYKISTPDISSETYLKQLGLSGEGELYMTHNGWMIRDNNGKFIDLPVKKIKDMSINGNDSADGVPNLEIIMQDKTDLDISSSGSLSGVRYLTLPYIRKEDKK